MELSVIIPAYNEEDRIVRTLKNIFSYLNRQKYQSEVIVVSDGSTDNTKDVAERMFDSGKTVSIKVFEYHPNRGKGYAVRFGIMKGCGSLLMFMDADYSVPMADVEKGRKLIADGYDIAIGSRSIVNSRVIRHQNFLREISAKLYT
ncbi:MAG TPA: glycosyltransferase, partial [Desulfobacterales bacterium]|nr:glycosyltransferase [Desulfobacterales bacterium]